MTDHAENTNREGTSHLWWMTFENGDIRFWDDEEELTEEEYRRRATSHDLYQLDCALWDYAGISSKLRPTRAPGSQNGD